MKRWLRMMVAAVISACSLGRAEQVIVEQSTPTSIPQQTAVITMPPTLIPPTAIPTIIPPTLSPSPTPNAQQQLLAQLPELGRAPELYNEVWLNTDRPLRLSELLGKVVLLDFWTYD